MSLFALVENPEQRIQKLKLNSDVQISVKEYFESMLLPFRGENTEEIHFDGKYHPEENELLYVDSFEDINGLLESSNNVRSLPDFEPSISNLLLTKALFVEHINVQGEKIILIQRFEKRRIISTDGFSIIYGGDCYKKIDGNGISLDSKLTAIMVGSKLYFKSFHMIRQIFDMSAYFAEATNADIDGFANSNMLSIPDISQFKDQADTWIRRKVSLITQSGILQNADIDNLDAVAKEFKIQLNIVGGKIIMPVDKRNIKVLLRFLDDDYYESPISKKQFISNSKRENSAS